jgi:hypothetical protein
MHSSLDQRSVDERKEIAARDAIYSRDNIFSDPIKQTNPFV